MMWGPAREAPLKGVPFEMRTLLQALDLILSTGDNISPSGEKLVQGEGGMWMGNISYYSDL